jgi:hypothetical protein
MELFAFAVMGFVGFFAISLFDFPFAIRAFGFRTLFRSYFTLRRPPRAEDSRFFVALAFTQFFFVLMVVTGTFQAIKRLVT